jgi:hypothetical protein
MQTQRIIFYPSLPWLFTSSQLLIQHAQPNNSLPLHFSLSHAMPMCVLVCVLYPHVCLICPVYTYIRKYCAGFCIFLSKKMQSCIGECCVCACALAIVATAGIWNRVHTHTNRHTFAAKVACLQTLPYISYLSLFQAMPLRFLCLQAMNISAYFTLRVDIHTHVTFKQGIWADTVSSYCAVKCMCVCARACV